MRCNEKETLSLGALLSQPNDHPPTPKPQYNMIDSLCGSKGSLKSIESSSYSKNLPPPPSPTDSVSESNVIASSDPDLTTTTTTTATTTPTTLLQSLKFDIDLDVEVQSPVDNSIWDSFLADQLDPSTDFMLISSPRRDYMMISSPKRDYMMISSPKRDYMISSPKRDNMISSPKREYMVITSPKRTNMSMNTSINSYNYGYAHGVQQAYGNPNPNTTTTTTSSSYSAKGKSQSPLHKVFNNSRAYNSSSSGGYETLLDGYGMYSNLKDESTTEVYEAAEEAVGGMTATLLECLGMPSLNARYGESSEGDHQGYVNGIGIGSSVDGGGEGGLMGLNEGSLGSCKSEIGEHGNIINANYHGLLGPITTCDQTEQEQDNGLHLVHLLLACAESVAKDDYVSARRFLHHLDRTVSPLGDSMQRVASCFADALSARLLSPHPSPSHPALPSPSLDTLKFYQILYQACPYVKFAHFTANQAIFEAFEAEAHVHVIDLDILQGYQWPAFLQALAALPGGPPSLRITGVGYPAQVVRETGRHLAELAHSLRVPFEFHPAVADRLEDLRPHMLHRRVGEALAVNSVNRLHRVPGPHLGNLLAMIRDQAPNIVTLVEQEASHNGSHFLGRFLEALHYYSAIFDSLDATFPPDSAARAKVEQYIFQPEIRNIVACEGPARFERHERLEKWRKIMEGKGFKGVDLSPNAVAQSKILLGLYSCDGYRLTEDKGCLLLGWQDRPIIAASAWRC